MKHKYKKIIYCLFALLVIGYTSDVKAQNCTTALQPMNVVVTDVGPSGIPPTAPGTLSETGAINVAWDPQCGARAGDGCEFGDNNSLFWYVGIYGQNAPTPNGIDRECGVTAVTLDCPAVAPAVGLAVNNGGDYNGMCLAPKSSTCVSSEFSQRRPVVGGDITSWHTFGDDGTGTLGACDGPMLNLTLPICPGQCYNVVVWEFVIDQPSGTGPNADGGAGGTGTPLPFPGMDANISCGNMTLLSESPPSDVISICIDAPDGTDNALIENPTLTLTNSVNGDPAASICDGLNNVAYTGTFQSQPEDIGDPSLADPCEGSNVDVCNSINNVTDPLASDGTVDQTIGGTGNGGDAGDLTVTFAGGGGNSANGQLNLGAHVVEVNCREDIGIVFSTPEGCKGFTDQSVFGLPPCDFSDGTLLSTNAKVYISVNGMPLPGVAVEPYPACYTGTDGTGTCATNNATGYGADYTAQFGNFISSDDVNDPCITNLVGNPFQGDGANPLALPGAVSGVDFGDGVARDVATVCVKYEDPCDGSKSVTCVKFISDAPPLDAAIAACNETCPGAGDGAIIIYDVAGGSDDPNSDSVYTDGGTGTGSYEIDIVAGPVTGQVFTYAGGSSWQATGLPPGVYTVDIRDVLAPGDTFDADADDTNAACGAACTIQRVVEILAGPILPVTPTVVQPTCTDDGMASIVIDKISTMSNGPVTFESGPGTSPGDFVTPSAAATTVTSGLFAGCPSDALGLASVVEICIDNFTAASGDLSGTQLLIGVNGAGPNLELDQGTAFGNGGTLTGASITQCFSITYNGTSIAAFFAGFPANGFTLEVHANDGFGAGDTYTFDNLSITINDVVCTTEANIMAFCDDLGPDNGDGTGAITSADQTLTWTSANGIDTGAEPAFDFITLAGPGENDAIFDNQAALDAGVAPGTMVCYGITGYVPGNEFDNVNAITDNTGFLNDIGVGDAAMGCYAGVCCEVTEEVCFTVFPKPLPPTSTPVCSCAGDSPVALTATGMCDPTQETETSGVISGDGTVMDSPFGLPGGYSSYTVVGPSDPACNGVAEVVLVSGPDNAGIILNGVQIYADGPGFGGATPAYGTAVVTGVPVASGDLFEFYGFDGGLNPADLSFQINITYTCPAATPAYTWYGDDGDSDGMLPDPTLGTVVGTGPMYTPAAGDVDMFGNAFDPATCGNFTFCATVDCDGCVSDAECFVYTVNPSESSASPIDLGTICEGDDIPVADLAGANGGDLDYTVCEDAALMMNCVTITDGMFILPVSAAGSYTYYYTGTAVPCMFPDFVEDPACVCSADPSTIILTISPPPEPSTCDGPIEVCAGNPDAEDLTLTATCDDCPEVPNPLSCGTDPCNLPDASCGVVVTNTVVIMESIPFSIDYEGDNANYSEALAIEVPAGTAAECCNVTFDYVVDYTITPFGPSWTSEVSFDIVGPGGTVIVANTGAGLPGSGNNNTPIGGSVGGSSASTVGGFAGGVTLNVQDNFDDAGVDGTFAGTVTYTLTVEVCEVENATYDGDPMPGGPAGIQWCVSDDVGPDGMEGTADDTYTVLTTGSGPMLGFDPSVDDPNFDVNTPGIYNYYSACICQDCPSEKTLCEIIINENPTATPVGGMACEGAGDVTIMSGPAGGTTPYTFTWAGPNGQSATTQDVTLSPVTANHVGIWTVTVTDANGCEVIETVEVGIFEPPTIAPTANMPCDGQADLMITGNPAGGTAPYTFIWAGPNGQAPTDENPTVSPGTIAADAGTWNVTITDDNGCTGTGSVLVTLLDQPAAPIPVDVSFCKDAPEFVLEVKGGCDNVYWYDQDGSTPLGEATAGDNIYTLPGGGLTTGVYTYYAQCGSITDGQECLSDLAPVQITIFPTMTIEIDYIKCDGNPNGLDTPEKGKDLYTYCIRVDFCGPWPVTGGTIDVYENNGSFVAAGLTPNMGDLSYQLDCFTPTTAFEAVANGVDGLDVSAISFSPEGATMCGANQTFPPVPECSCFTRLCEDITDYAGPTATGMAPAPYVQTYVLVDAGGVVTQESPTSTFDLSAAAAGTLCTIAAVNYDPATITITPNTTTLESLIYPTGAECVDVSFECCYVYKVELPNPPTIVANGPFCAMNAAIIEVSCEKDNVNTASLVNWYNDDGGAPDLNAPIALDGGSSITAPQTGTPGMYSIWACCEFVDDDATDLCQTCTEVMFEIDPDPVPTFDCPVVGRCDDPVDLNPMDPSGLGGVWSGTGVNFVDPATNTFDPSGAPIDCPLTLIYTVTSPNGCEGSATCTFMVTENCLTNPGSFDGN